MSSSLAAFCHCFLRKNKLFLGCLASSVNTKANRVLTFIGENVTTEIDFFYLYLFLVNERQTSFIFSSGDCDYSGIYIVFFSFLFTQTSGLGQASIYHALVVIFLEFFAWGLLTSPIISVSVT